MRSKLMGGRFIGEGGGVHVFLSPRLQKFPRIGHRICSFAFRFTGARARRPMVKGNYFQTETLPRHRLGTLRPQTRPPTPNNPTLPSSHTPTIPLLPPHPP